jgi:steroid delta-isomerase-like uncharacterized protein
MARRHFAAVAIALLAGCGGEEAAAPPPAAPAAAPPAAPTAMGPSAEATPAPAPKPSLADLEKKALGDWYTAFNAHDASKLGSLYAPDGVTTRPGPGGWSEPRTGQDAIAKSFAGLFTGFPDLKAAPIRVFQKQDLVVVQWAAVGTNGGELMGPASNKKAGLYGADVFWFDDSGAIKRHETFHDDVNTMRQLGKMPGKARDLAVLPDKDADWVVAAGTPDEDALVEKMKATWPATWSKRDGKAYDAVINDDSEHLDYGGPADFKGRAALMKEFETYAKAMPDMNATVDKGWGFAPGIVVAEFTFTGTLKGNLGPIKATNKEVTTHGLEIDELKDGKLQKGYTYANSMELLAAVGALPKPKAAKPEGAHKGAATDKPAAKK